jgi:hypothetical protein
MGYVQYDASLNYVPSSRGIRSPFWILGHAQQIFEQIRSWALKVRYHTTAIIASIASINGKKNSTADAHFDTQNISPLK